MIEILGLIALGVGFLLYVSGFIDKKFLDSLKAQDVKDQITQKESEDAIRELDKGIATMKEKKANEKPENLSDEERADKWD